MLDNIRSSLKELKRIHTDDPAMHKRVVRVLEEVIKVHDKELDL